MKGISWAYQCTSLSETELEKTLDALDNIGADYTNFGLIPFSDELSWDKRQNPDNPVIALGSTKMVKLWLENKLPANWKIFYNRHYFSQINQRDFLVGKHNRLWNFMLNADSKIHNFRYFYDNELDFSVDKFIRPDSDLKLFNGQILPANTSLKQLFSTQTVDSEVFTSQEFFIAAPIQKIIREYRCFVVGRRVIDFCIYKEDGALIKNKIDLGKKFNNLRIKHLALKFKPAEVYVADIAELEDSQFKIIEYNCFNCSGYYFCDREKIFKAIEEYMISK